MKKPWVFVLSATAVVGLALLGTAAAPQSPPVQKPKIRPDVVQRVQDKGIAKVGVVLSGQWESDAKLNGDARLAQRQAIADTQQRLLAELAGTRHRVLRLYDLPGLTLEIGPDALAVLENSPLVKEVYLQEDVFTPSLWQSVPLIGGNADFTDYATVAMGQGPKVRPEVVQWIQDKGVAKVGVQLSGQWELDSKLSPDARLAQRHAIAAAQESLLAELAGTPHKVLRRSAIGPFLSLEIGPDALTVLENSPLVKDVFLQQNVYRPILLQSVPLIGGPQTWAGANAHLTSYGTVAMGMQPKVRPDVLQWLQTKGVAKVGIELSGQWENDAKLTPDTRTAQRQEIAVAQQTLLAELAGTRHRVLSLSTIGPFLDLEIGPDALAVLENSPLVKDVHLGEMVLTPMGARPKVRPDVVQRVQEKGVAEVGVVLSGQWQLGQLSRDAELAQREAIAAAQQRLIAELAGTRHRVLRTYTTIPALTLDIRPDALAVLEQSSLVKEVNLQDAVLTPHLLESVPLIGGSQAWASGFDGDGRAVEPLSAFRQPT